MKFKELVQKPLFWIGVAVVIAVIYFWNDIMKAIRGNGATERQYRLGGAVTGTFTGASTGVGTDAGTSTGGTSSPRPVRTMVQQNIVFPCTNPVTGEPGTFANGNSGPCLNARQIRQLTSVGINTARMPAACEAWIYCDGINDAKGCAKLWKDCVSANQKS